MISAPRAPRLDHTNPCGRAAAPYHRIHHNHNKCRCCVVGRKRAMVEAQRAAVEKLRPGAMGCQPMPEEAEQQRGRFEARQRLEALYDSF